VPFSLTYRLVSAVRPLKPNSVILVCTRGDVLNDNLACIFDRLDRQTYDVRAFFFSGRRGWWAQLAAGVRFVAAMARTEYTIVDDFFPTVYPITVRRGARLIQVWHALGALKRVGYSRGGVNGGPPLTSIAHKNYTDVIISADSLRGNYAEAFGVPLDAVQATGVPRSDLFFDSEQQSAIVQGLYAQIPVLQHRHVILFAPTFRGRGKQSAYYPESFLDLEQLGAALDGNDLLVLKMHPFVRQCPPIPQAYSDRIIDLGAYPEFNHLLLVADRLVTDYSSAIFDYALLRRPVIFYVPDLDTYDAERGFYYPFQEYVYGPVARDIPTLIGALRASSTDTALADQFREKFLNRCDGHATQRFIDTVMTHRPGAVLTSRSAHE